MYHKILCVDLDATLLCDDKSITQKNREAIHRMLEAGHYIALATGRPVETAREVARELGLNTPGCYMIAFNGAVLYDCAADRVLLKRSLPIEIVQELLIRQNVRACMCRHITARILLPQSIRKNWITM